MSSARQTPGAGAMKPMKKLLIFVCTVLVIFAALAGAAIWYVKPTEALDLNYREVPIGGKIVDMIKNRKFEVLITEAEINDLVKKQLAAHRELPHDIRIEGAALQLRGNELQADVNLLWREQIPVGAKLFFNVEWNSPNIEIVHTSTQIKEASLPSSLLQLPPLRISLEEHLPKLVGVRNVSFEENGIRIGFKLGQSAS